MSLSWIHEQAERNIAQFEKAMEASCPDARTYLQDPKAYLARIAEQCNYLAAADLIEWPAFFGTSCTVLDLGCGGGWLTGYLSKFESVSKIYALDSSKYFLSELMPQIIALMGGCRRKSCR